jgi:hypothetical protein
MMNSPEQPETRNLLPARFTGFQGAPVCRRGSERVVE